MTAHVFSFLATYALHSSFLLAVALLATAWIRSASWREVVLRAALFGSLGTSAAALLVADATLVGRWTLPEHVTLPGSAALRLPFRLGDPIRRPEQRRLTASVTRASQSSAPRSAAAGGEADWRTVAVGVWAGGALLMLGRLLLRHALLRRRLSQRREIRSGPLRELLTALCTAEGAGRRVRLSDSDAAGVPFAFGRSEVCVPTWFAEALSRPEQRAALAHELAHLSRRDPDWRLLEAVLRAVLFFQPLNRACAARLRAVAEDLCDDAAVRLTGEPLALARCLNTVAGRAQGQPVLPAVVAGMAATDSALVSRVQRLTRWRDGGLPRARTRLLASTLALALAAWVGPAVVLPAEAASQPAALSTRSGTALARVDSTLVSECSRHWRRIVAQQRDDVRTLLVAGSAPPTPVLLIVDGQLAAPEQASAWRALPLPEQDRLLSRVEVLRRTTAERIAGEPVPAAVACLVTAPDAVFPAALRPGRS